MSPNPAHQFHHGPTGTVFTPLVLFGKDVTIHDLSAAASFFTSRSGTVTRDLLDTVLSTILHQDVGDEERQLLLPHFFNLWPVPRHRFLWDLQVEHAATILDLLRPLVLDTCLDFLQHPHLVPAAPGSQQFANQLLQESLNREPVGFTALLDQSRNALNDYRSNDAQGILLYEATIQVI